MAEEVPLRYGYQMVTRYLSYTILIINNLTLKKEYN